MFAVNRRALMAMPHYFFHFVWADDAVKDEDGVELEGLKAAYRHAVEMVPRVRVKFPDAGDEWLIEIPTKPTGDRLSFFPGAFRCLDVDGPQAKKSAEGGRGSKTFTSSSSPRG